MITVKLKGLAPQRFQSAPEAMQFCMAHVQIHSSLVIAAIKKLANLESLPASGFQVSCFPYKIKHASAGFVRAVAIFEE